MDPYAGRAIAFSAKLLRDCCPARSAPQTVPEEAISGPARPNTVLLALDCLW